MTRRRDARAPRTTRRCATLVGCFAPVVTLVGKTWDLHLEKVTGSSLEENLAMIADSVAFLAREGKRVIYDAEHFFDGYRDDPDYALRVPARPRSTAGAENVTPLRHQRLQPARAGRRGDRGAWSPTLGERAEVGIHTHNDAESAVANSLAAVEAGAPLVQGTINGFGERCGNANLVSILPALQLKLGYECVPRRAARGADRDRALRRRDLPT